ncbi:hypothetical protein GCM10020369_59970 [Cryptosporangium minutisporangium]|uniref:Uncharacterized protein n=1 Tax=Cryptosporangium minutisporangium TaxID=113569 RepID=A0ABP6T697_9ACTN
MRSLRSRLNTESSKPIPLPLGARPTGPAGVCNWVTMPAFGFSVLRGRLGLLPKRSSPLAPGRQEELRVVRSRMPDTNAAPGPLTGLRVPVRCERTTADR